MVIMLPFMAVTRCVWTLLEVFSAHVGLDLNLKMIVMPVLVSDTISNHLDELNSDGSCAKLVTMYRKVHTHSFCMHVQSLIEFLWTFCSPFYM